MSEQIATNSSCVRSHLDSFTSRATHWKLSMSPLFSGNRDCGNLWSSDMSPLDRLTDAMQDLEERIDNVKVEFSIPDKS